MNAEDAEDEEVKRDADPVDATSRLDRPTAYWPAVSQEPLATPHSHLSQRV